MTPPKSAKRLNIALGPAAIEALDDVCHAHAMTHVDVMRKSLWLFVKVVKLLRTGGSVMFCYPDGRKTELEPL